MAQPYSGRRILLVDDESLFRRTTAEALEDEFPGLTVSTAADGAQALHELKDGPEPDLLITDLQMPVMDGYTLLARLVSMRCNVPVIVLTAYSNESARQLLTDERALELLDKPVDFDQLVVAVRPFLGARTPALRHVTVHGFLQLLETERQTCQLRITMPRLARLWVRRGMIVGGAVGATRGLEAVYQILSWSDAAFTVADLPAAGEFDVEVPISRVLLDSARIEDEQSRGADADEWFSELFTEDTAADSSRVSETLNIEQKDTQSVPSVQKKEPNMASIEETLNTAHSLDGSLGVALADYESGMCLGMRGGGADINLEIAAAGNTEVVRAKQRVMRDLDIGGGIQDILITLNDQYHIILPIPNTTIFLYSALKRDKANLALARMKLTSAGKALVV